MTLKKITKTKCVKCDKELTYAWSGGAQFNYCGNDQCDFYGIYQIGIGGVGLDGSKRKK